MDVELKESLLNAPGKCPCGEETDWKKNYPLGCFHCLKECCTKCGSIEDNVLTCSRCHKKSLLPSSAREPSS